MRNRPGTRQLGTHTGLENKKMSKSEAEGKEGETYMYPRGSLLVM